MQVKFLSDVFFENNEVSALPLPGESGRFPALISGLSQVHRANLMGALRVKTGRSLVVLCPDEAGAEALRGDLRAFTGEEPNLLLSRDFVFVSADAVSHESEQKRIGAL